MNKAEFISNPASNVIAFDPSQNYTGWLLYKPAEHRIVRYGCIRKSVLLAGMEFTGVMQEREAFQKKFSFQLRNLLSIVEPDHTQVVMERPIGSQSARAAWGLAMASQGVTTATICMLNKEPITYSERDAKMHFFHRDNVDKAETSKLMWAYWKGQGINEPEHIWKDEHRKTELRKMKEAVADSMLLLNLHNHILTTNG